MATSRLRLMLVDDHEIVRVGLCAALGKRHAVVGSTPTAAEALERIAQVTPDVVITDLRLPDMRGEQLCRRIRETWPSTEVVILSAYQSVGTVRSAMKSGAAAYITKAAGVPEVLRILDELGARSTPKSPDSASQIASRLDAMVAARPETIHITSHQENILELAAQGFTNDQISRRMFVSESTVRFHLQNLKKKLGARSKTDLIARAIRTGVISPALEDLAGV